MNTQDAPSMGQIYSGKEEVEIGGHQVLVEFQYSLSDDADEFSAGEFNFHKASIMIGLDPATMTVSWLDITDYSVELNEDFGDFVYNALTESLFRFVAQESTT